MLLTQKEALVAFWSKLHSTPTFQFTAETCGPEEPSVLTMNAGEAECDLGADGTATLLGRMSASPR
jgi:hypothetical protein